MTKKHIFKLLLITFLITLKSLYAQENLFWEQYENIQKDPSFKNLNAHADFLAHAISHAKISLSEAEIGRDNLKKYKHLYADSIDLLITIGTVEYSYYHKMFQLNKSLFVFDSVKQHLQTKELSAYFIYQFYNSIGSYLISVGDINQGIALLEEADKTLFTEVNAINLRKAQNALIVASNSIGYGYSKLNDFQNALDRYNISLKRASIYNDSTWMGIISGNLASIYLHYNEFDTAIALLKNDIRLSLKGNMLNSALNALNLLCEIFLETRQLDQVNASIHDFSENLKKLDPSNEETLYHRNNLAFLKLKYFNLTNQIDSADFYANLNNDFHRKLTKNIEAKNLEYRKSRYLSENETLDKLRWMHLANRKNILNWSLLFILIISSLFLFFIYRKNKLLKQNSIEILHKTEALEKLNQEKNKLFSVLAHDLKNPVNNLNSILDLYSDGALNITEFQNLANQTNSTLKNLSEVITNLLNWSKASFENGIQVRNENVYLDKLLKDVFLELAPMSSVKNVHLISEITPEYSIFTDPLIAKVILRNLLANALKFSKPNNNIIVKIENIDSHMAKFIIQDFGVGMNPEQIMSLNSSKTFIKSTIGTLGEKGSGLGLMLVKDFCDRLIWKIHFHSERNVGTSVEITFPRTH